MRSFVKIKSSRNGEITLSFTDKVKSCPSRDFLASQICILALFVKIIFSRKLPDLQHKESRYCPQYREDREERSSQVRWCSLIHVVALSRENQTLCVCFQKGKSRTSLCSYKYLIAEYRHCACACRCVNVILSSSGKRVTKSQTKLRGCAC